MGCGVSETVIEKAIDTYGWELQTIVAIEEMSELTKELTKYLRGIGVRKHLIEEVADVIICLEEILKIYKLDDKEINLAIEQKIKRLEDRICQNATIG